MSKEKEKQASPETEAVAAEAEKKLAEDEALALAAADEAKPKLVKMQRIDYSESGPNAADVDPAEVENMIRGGWRVSK